MIQNYSLKLFGISTGESLGESLGAFKGALFSLSFFEFPWENLWKAIFSEKKIHRILMRESWRKFLRQFLVESCSSFFSNPTKNRQNPLEYSRYFNLPEESSRKFLWSIILGIILRVHVGILQRALWRIFCRIILSKFPWEEYLKGKPLRFFFLRTLVKNLWECLGEFFKQFNGECFDD